MQSFKPLGTGFEFSTLVVEKPDDLLHAANPGLRENDLKVAQVQVNPIVSETTTFVFHASKQHVELAHMLHGNDQKRLREVGTDLVRNGDPPLPNVAVS